VFAAFVAAGLLVNAAVTGGLSGPYDRSFARVVWLVGLVALLTLRYVAKVDEKADEKAEHCGAAVAPALGPLLRPKPAGSHAGARSGAGTTLQSAD
jgi:hypothetical protein